ncbi:MAG: WYL domain-containing protein [Nakamurella sp.]
MVGVPSGKSAAKAERLLNLVIALLNSERFRDVNWIRDKVEGYRDAANDEAFFRMFERDKVELRDIGIPLQTSEDGAYRIPPGEYALPEMSFTPGEKAALALAGRLWETSVLGEAGSGALRKLSDASNDQLTGSRLSLQPRVRTSDPAFGPLYAAVQARQVVSFPYRKDPAGAAENRRLQPWGLVSWKGRWYVVGQDVGRGEPRTFRLSRIAGEVSRVGRTGAVVIPAEVDLLAFVAGSQSPVEQRSATVQLAVGRGAGLRRRAVEADSGDALPGFDRFTVPFDHLWDTARSIAALGPDAVVEAPADLRDAVIRLLTDAAAVAGTPPPTEPTDAELS